MTDTIDTTQSTESTDATEFTTAPDPTDAADFPVAADAAPEEPQRTTFADLGLSPDLLATAEAAGFQYPTPIQEQVIPVLLAGRDAIGQAQTGSGKTAAFGFPIIDAIDPTDRHVQALILCPTRELAIQVAEALDQYGRHKRVETLPIYGGQPYERQFRGLQRGVQIVVGTPGRVMDHMRRGTLHLDHLKFFILDEADEMLDMGFIEDIEWILESVPTERQTALFSATMPPRIADLASTYLNEPERISVRGKQMTVAEVNQSSYEFPRGKKVEALTRILEAENPTSAIIFCRTKRSVDELGEGLLSRGFAVDTLHGDLSQAQRDRVMRRFRTGQAQVLIATDVAARGLDIENVSHVINYDAPESVETYVHRIGRTGRAGRSGEAITLVSPREFRWLRQAERVTKATITPKRLPSMADVNERRRERLKDLVRNGIENETAYNAYIAPIEELADELDSTKMAALLLKMYAEQTGLSAGNDEHADELANFGGKFERENRRERGDRGDRGDRGFDRGTRGPRGGGATEAGMTRLFFNIGHNLRIRPQDFVGAIAGESGIPGRVIGAIDIHEAYSFVDVPSGDAQRVIDAMNASAIKGRSVNVEIAGNQGESRAPRAPRGPRSEFHGNDRRFDRGPREGGFRRRDDDRGGRGFRRDGGFSRDRDDRRGPRRDRY